MKKSDFYYNLPEELIAQTPIEPRDASRLFVLNKEEKIKYVDRNFVLTIMDEGLEVTEGYDDFIYLVLLLKAYKAYSFEVVKTVVGTENATSSA